MASRRALYFVAGALGVGGLAALLLSRSRGMKLLPGEPDWNLGRPMSRVFITEGWGHSRPGRLHGSLDLRATHGTNFMAMHGGKVIFAGTYSDGNTAIEIDHGDGMIARYLHHSRAFVQRGDVVREGQAIGQTGTAKSPHLHLDAWVLASQVPMYRARFGSPRGLGDESRSFVGGERFKIPLEPLVPTDTYQADVASVDRRFGVTMRPEAVVA